MRTGSGLLQCSIDDLERLLFIVPVLVLLADVVIVVGLDVAAAGSGLVVVVVVFFVVVTGSAGGGDDAGRRCVHLRKRVPQIACVAPDPVRFRLALRRVNTDSMSACWFQVETRVVMTGGDDDSAEDGSRSADAAGRMTVTTTDIHLPRRIAEAVAHAYRGELVLEYGKNEYRLRAEWRR